MAIPRFLFSGRPEARSQLIDGNFLTATGWLLAQRREADDKETAP